MTIRFSVAPSLARLLLPAILAGCASKAPVASPAPTPTVTAGSGAADAAKGPGVTLPTPPARVDRQLLTRDEMRKTEFTNLFEIIRALRGNWLRVRAAESFGKSSDLVVYLDMQRIGSIDELRTISPVNVLTVRYFDPIQASARWGMDHGGGALMVTTSKR